MARWLRHAFFSEQLARAAVALVSIFAVIDQRWRPWQVLDRGSTTPVPRFAKDMKKNNETIKLAKNLEEIIEVGLGVPDVFKYRGRACKAKFNEDLANNNKTTSAERNEFLDATTGCSELPELVANAIVGGAKKALADMHAVAKMFGHGDEVRKEIPPKIFGADEERKTEYLKGLKLLAGKDKKYIYGCGVQLDFYQNIFTFVKNPAFTAYIKGIKATSLEEPHADFVAFVYGFCGKEISDLTAQEEDIGSGSAPGDAETAQAVDTGSGSAPGDAE